MKIKRYLLILIYASSVFALMATQDNVKADNLDGLRSAFSLEKTEHLSPFDLETLYVAFDLGEEALPFLEGILSDPNKERSYPDSNRAICSVGLTFGPKNGSGYDFVLRKNAGVWEVIGVMPT